LPGRPEVWKKFTGIIANIVPSVGAEDAGPWSSEISKFVP